MRIEKNQLYILFQSIQFSYQFDSLFWHLDKSEVHSVHSLYKFLNSGGVHTTLTTTVWSLKISLKIKLLVWLALQNKILTGDNLLKRGWIGPS
jgi:zinc-binding in reverse transcriptase